jgi:protein-S-isoprenylcysteine O-methyltransferase Ste14
VADGRNPRVVHAPANDGLRRVAAVIARKRVAAGFVLSILVIWLSQPTPRMLAIGAAIALAGEAVRIWAAGHLEKGREVTSSGPYALTRHPLYLGSSLIAAGIAIASARITVVIIIVAYIGITVAAAVSTEEAQLTERFGDRYPDYREGRVTAPARRFSVGRAIRNREYRAVIGLGAALALLAWKASR